jgi:hypothetical protein
VTAKEQLLQYVQGLTEEEAIDKLPWVVGPEPEFPAAPPEVMSMFRRAMEDSEAGRSLSDEEFGRRFGLD